MKRFTSLVVLAAGAVAGCQDASTPTGPSADAAAPVASIAASPEEVAGLGAALGDATTRLAPSFKDAVIRAELRGLLGDLSDQLTKGDAAAARRSLGLARKTLQRLAARGDQAAAGADLDGISLALDQVEVTLNGGQAEQDGK